MMMLHRKVFVGATLVASLLASAAFAGTISNTVTPTASGPGLGLVIVPQVFTLNPNNDNREGGEPNDNNFVIPLKRFDFNALIDLVFTVVASDGVTEYKITEFVDNNTGVNWASYRMQLGFDTGINFTPSGGLDGLDFDSPDFDDAPISPAMPFVALGADELLFFGGNQGTGAQPYTFRLDIPDGINTFTLRQIPTVIPEPSVVALSCLALVGLIGLRRRG